MSAALWRRAAFLLALGSWLVSAASGSAQAGSTERRDWASMIRVEAGTSCLEQARLVEHVSAWFGGRVVAPSFDVLVRGDAARPQAVQIELHNGLRRYQREFAATPETCDDRHAVIALAIALAVGAELAANLGALHAPAREPRRTARCLRERRHARR
jgi:hypothetical protein